MAETVPNADRDHRNARPDPKQERPRRRLDGPMMSRHQHVGSGVDASVEQAVFAG
jgi:hypothetical protein